MTIIDQLKSATARAQIEDDLPDYLAERIYALTKRLDDATAFVTEIEDLVAQVSDYDTYAQTGYIGMGVDAKILESGICRLEQKTKNVKNKQKG